jgi:hypothetical protein
MVFVMKRDFFLSMLAFWIKGRVEKNTASIFRAKIPLQGKAV